MAKSRKRTDPISSASLQQHTISHLRYRPPRRFTLAFNQFQFLDIMGRTILAFLSHTFRSILGSPQEFVRTHIFIGVLQEWPPKHPPEGFTALMLRGLSKVF
jgi:hypothetical protein